MNWNTQTHKKYTVINWTMENLNDSIINGAGSTACQPGENAGDNPINYFGNNQRPNNKESGLEKSILYECK